MSTDELIIQEMLDRATNPASDKVDELAVQMFCMVVGNNSQLIPKSHEIILDKVRSKDVTEATRAIALLEECMTKCGSVFQDEISKHRFLNNFITLVLNKFDGANTPVAVKQRIMECLLLWTTEFPQKQKIRTVYDMLRKEGNIAHCCTPAIAGVQQRESVLGNDEDVFAKLIKSGDPENFKRANLLLQHRVNEEARRTELMFQHKSELEKVKNTINLLNQMLDNYEFSPAVADDDETMIIIRELFIDCKKYKPMLKHLVNLIENINEQLLADTLEANDLLREVLERYKNVVVHPAGISDNHSINSATQSEAATGTSSANNATDLLTDLLSDIPEAALASNAKIDLGVDLIGGAAAAAPATPNTTPTTGNTLKTLDELHDIFGNVNLNSSEQNSSENNEITQVALFAKIDLLEPTRVFPDLTQEALEKENNDYSKTETRSNFRGLPEIDQLSNELFKMNLPTNNRVGSFKKELDRITLNDLVKEKTKVKPATNGTTNKNADQISISSKSSANLPFTDNEDDVMLNSGASEADLQSSVALPATSLPPFIQSDSTTSTVELPVKPLAEININISDVVPTTDAPIELSSEDDDVQITLNYTTERPSKHVSVIVISALNKSRETVKDFHFEASVKKPCKVRLLPPTSQEMPPYKPFCPAPVNQVMLLSNATGHAVDVTCIVGYKLGNDPDPFKESIIAKGIPYVD